jgi:hypothetical protein
VNAPFGAGVDFSDVRAGERGGNGAAEQQRESLCAQQDE